MATAIAHTFKPTRSRVLTVVTILAILFGCYGLLSAQQARSATGLPEQVWGGINRDGTIQHQKHITKVHHFGPGQYKVRFDRHVDNCAIEITARIEGEGGGPAVFFVDIAGSTSEVLVYEETPGGTAPHDGDFDIFGMCPST